MERPMPTLKDFIESHFSKRKDLPLLNATPEFPALTKSIGVNLVSSGALANNSEETKFSHGVAELVSSEKFVSELSDQIGKPRDDESEVEFVNRAKNSLRALLERRVLK